MSLGPLGIWEILVIVGVALLIFGPTQLPKIARGAGKIFKDAKDFKDEVTGGLLEDEPPKPGKRTPSSRTDAEAGPAAPEERVGSAPHGGTGAGGARAPGAEDASEVSAGHAGGVQADSGRVADENAGKTPS